MRTKRTDGTNTYSYVYNGSQLVEMTAGENTLYFTYDSAGIPATVAYNGTAYYYTTNVQGDITGILQSDGTQVVTYTYDAWGNILSCTGSMADTLGAINPLRYRGYVYDPETKLYYLQSRYYDPEIGRFVNSDGFAATGQGLISHNTFAYCLNSSVNRVDASGKISEDAADELIENYAEEIIDIAEEYNVDPVAVAACIYTEQVLNYDWKDSLFDYLLFALDTSIGIGQVRVSTAIMLEDAGYVDKTEGMLIKQIAMPAIYISRQQLVAGKLRDNKTNIQYVAAYIKYWQDKWQSVLDISGMPEILGTLYNLGENANKPNINPKPNKFGKYISEKLSHLKDLLGLN